MVIIKVFIILLVLLIIFVFPQTASAVDFESYIIELIVNEDLALLNINFSIEILNYGGSRLEYYLLKDIKNFARDIRGVGFLNIMIENRIKELAEGSLIFNYNLWYN